MLCRFAPLDCRSKASQAPTLCLACALPHRRAGKSGALGHGDTAKRAVGRQVKALAGHAVNAVACGADWVLVAAGWRPPASKAGRNSRSSRAGGAQLQSEPPSPSFKATAATGFAYKEVEPEPASPRPARQRTGNGGQHCGRPGSNSGSGAGLLPGSVPSTPRPSHSAGAGPASNVDTNSGGNRLRGPSRREQRREWEAEDQEGARSGRGGRRRLEQAHRTGGWPALPDAAPEAALARRQRWMREPPAIPSPITPPDMDSGSEAEGASARRKGGGMHSGVDREMAYLMRRQLKVGRATRPGVGYAGVPCNSRCPLLLRGTVDRPASARVPRPVLGAFPACLNAGPAGLQRGPAAAGAGLPQDLLLARPLEGGCWQALGPSECAQFVLAARFRRRSRAAHSCPPICQLIPTGLVLRCRLM